MKRALLITTFFVFGLLACQNANDSTEKDSKTITTPEELKVDESKVTEMEELSTELEEVKKKIDETTTELDSLVENL